MLLVSVAECSERNGADTPRQPRSNVATQKSEPKVIDGSQLSTYRLCQSITAARYTKPPRTRMYVISLRQTWSGVSIDSPYNR